MAASLPYGSLARPNAGKPSSISCLRKTLNQRDGAGEGYLIQSRTASQARLTMPACSTGSSTIKGRSSKA
jgi:hypothetical protein